MILVKELNRYDLEKHYITNEDTIAVSISWNNEKKCSVKHAKESLDNILKIAKHFDIDTIYCTDGTYFKALTKVKKLDPYYGSIIKCTIKGYEYINCILSINYKTLIFSPKQQSKLDLANGALLGKSLGTGIIHFEEYPSTFQDIHRWLQKLLEEPVLACDTENYGIALVDADIASMSLSWSQNEGIAFPVNDFIKESLKDFFINYKGTLIFHNATYDIRNIIYRCFMNGHMDIKGMLHGLHTMYRSVHDTKIIAYLATNSTEGNELSLKALALEYAGNYALLDEEADITKHELKDLLKYNLIDTLSTWYVYNKYYPLMVKDNQEKIYREIMLPSLKTITQMELTGMPMLPDKINEADVHMSDVLSSKFKELRVNPIIRKYEWILQNKAFQQKNGSLKKKFIPLEDFKTVINTNSNPQIQGLLYEYMQLPVIELTKNKSPSTSGDTIEKLLEGLINQYGITEEELNGTSTN